MVSGAMQGGCVCENAPLLRIGTNNIEFAALFAPKPLGMSAAIGPSGRPVSICSINARLCSISPSSRTSSCSSVAECTSSVTTAISRACRG